MKVLLIGGSSDLGRELGKVLPYEFTNFDIKNDNLFVPDFIQGSLTKKEDLLFLKEKHFDVIVHIAGVHPILKDSNNEDLMQSVNVDGVKNVLESIWNPLNFIFISSSAAKNTKSPYGKTKAQAEKIVEYYATAQKQGAFALRTKGFTPYYSPSYKQFIDYANWAITGSVHILDVVKAVDLCLKNPRLTYEMFVVDGKQDFTPQDQKKWSKQNLLKKYPEALDLVNELTIPKSAPTYSKPENSVGYEPSFGFSKVVDEFLKKKKHS